MKPLLPALPTGSLIALLVACSSSPVQDEGACTSDDQCKGTRICEAGACVEADDSTGGSASTGGGSDAGGGDVSTPGGPTFLSFGTDVQTLDGAGDTLTVTFTAVLTDPDGVDDLIGGSLLDGSGAPYGAFATSGQEGAYRMELTWDAIAAVSPIEFAGIAERSFTAQFFDVAGHVAERQITIGLKCGDGGDACDSTCWYTRCGDQCITLGSDENCTACGDDCGSGFCTYDDNDDPMCFGAENTDALCSDGKDNDGDGYFDCVDYNCSQNPSVTVCN